MEKNVRCDVLVSAKMKEKTDKTLVRPAMFVGLEAMPLRKRQEAEMKMLRCPLGVTRMEMIT